MPLLKHLAILFAFIAFSAQAIEVEVKVFEKGTNAIEARAKALENAEKRGFSALIKQKAPDRAEEIIADYKNYNVSQYILGYHAKDEIVTDTSYRAKIVLDFDDRFVSNITQEEQTTSSQYNIPYENLKPTGNAILLLPVLRTPQGISLWEANNLWRDFVNEMILTHGEGNFVAPYGDPTDRLSINASNITTANFARLAPLVHRYGANRALVAIITERGNNGFGITLREISPQGDSIKTEHVEPQKGLNSRELMRFMAKDLISSYLDKQHKMQNPQQAAVAQVHEVEAKISLNNARDWSELRARLQKIESILEMQVLGADASGMTLQIAFKGEAKNFGQELISNGISAAKQNEQLWLALR